MIRKSSLNISVFVIMVLAFIIFTNAGSSPDFKHKHYPPSPEQKYWFQLQTDLFFSEEFPLPGYGEEEFGKLEYPALAVDCKRNVYLVYDFTKNGHEGIFLNSFSDANIKLQEVTDQSLPDRYLQMVDSPKWNAPLQVSTATGTEYRPRIAVAANDVVWIVWSARRAKQWEIYARRYAAGELGEEMQLTTNDVYDFRPVILADSENRIWIAWERGTVDKNMQIVARYFQDRMWSDEMILENRPGYAYRPALLEAGDGTIWFAWDYTTGYNTDVYLNSFKDGKLQQPIRVSTHPGIDCKAALAWHDQKLWVAWTTNRRGENGWGIIRYPIVRAFDGKSWYEPVTEFPGVDLESRSETQSYEYPTLTFDPFGRLYLFHRHDHVFSGAFYENDKWSENWLLDELGWGLRGFYVHSAWASDSELWLARRDRKSIFLQKMVRKHPQNSQPKLKKYSPKNYPEDLQGIAGDSHRGPTQHGDYQVYYGELHVHTAYSDGSGSWDELYNLYKNIYRLDFLAITDHDALRLGHNHFSPGEWAYLKALNEIYNQPGEFVTINAYEWTHSTWSGRQDSTVRIGHKNVYFKGGEESPFFNHHGDIAYDDVSLFKTLRKYDAIAFPHHPPWGGLRWETHDPEIQTNYEIVSIHGANEYPGNLPIPHRGGLPGTFAQDGLAQGKVIGFVGASDAHGLYYHANEGWRADPYKGGLTGVLLDTTLTRESVWEALKVRRNYATAGDKRYLDFSINGYPMGSMMTVSKPPTIYFEVRADDILYAYIIRNNKELFVSGRIGGDYTAYKGMQDATILPGKNFYYLRVVYKDGTVAWSSPIWVNYQPD